MAHSKYTETAVEFVARNPGCSKWDLASHLTWNSRRCPSKQYCLVNTQIRLGHIIAVRDGRQYRLYLPGDKRALDVTITDIDVLCAAIDAEASVRHTRELRPELSALADCLEEQQDPRHAFLRECVSHASFVRGPLWRGSGWGWQMSTLPAGRQGPARLSQHEAAQLASWLHVVPEPGDDWLGRFPTRSAAYLALAAALSGAALTEQEETP